MSRSRRAREQINRHLSRSLLRGAVSTTFIRYSDNRTVDLFTQGRQFRIDGRTKPISCLVPTLTLVLGLNTPPSTQRHCRGLQRLSVSFPRPTAFCSLRMRTPPRHQPHGCVQLDYADFLSAPSRNPRGSRRLTSPSRTCTVHRSRRRSERVRGPSFPFRPRAPRCSALAWHFGAVSRPTKDEPGAAPTGSSSATRLGENRFKPTPPSSATL